jgi:hypothetical protein
MNYLEQYYKNLCEQLQSQIDLLEKRFDISKFNKSKKGGKKDEKKGDKKDDKKSDEKDDKKSDKDYDGDGKVESSKAEYFGSKDKAIKKSIADKKKKKNLKEGREISGGEFTYGGFPRILTEAVKGPSSADMLQDFLDNDKGGAAGGPIDPETHGQISQHLSGLIKKQSLAGADSSHVAGLQAAHELLGGKGPFAAHIEEVLQGLGDEAHARGVRDDQNQMYFRGNR